MTQFSKVCGAYPVNNQILFFDGSDSHFDDGALRKIMWKNIQPFVMKACNSINNYPNYNSPNSKLNSIFNVAKTAWLLKYETTKFSPHYMNSVLVEAWDAFEVSSGNIIGDIFAKTMLLPSSLLT